MLALVMSVFTDEKTEAERDNLEFGHGVCGSASGSVPTDVGQPTIRVQNITVGGKGVK